MGEIPGNKNKARVLVVDDSLLVRVAITKTLTAKFNVAHAEDGEDAWEKICADSSIQVVFTDLNMPRLDGLGLIQRIRQSENENIRSHPVIVITGASDEDGLRRKVFEVGATDFITKPFKATELVARTESHVSYRRDKANLQKIASVDLLTGALNPSGVQEQLERDVSFVNRHAENLAIIIFELDGFKGIYERIGHQASNRLIKQVAASLKGAVRKEDSVGRYGMEKFIAILPMAKTEAVTTLARRLCALTESVKMTVDGDALPITMSAGICTARQGDRSTAKDLLDAAEQALANAKAVGPGEVQILRSEPREARHPTPLKVSIDSLLDTIHQGQTTVTKQQMDAVLHRLAPLVALMSDEQKKQLIE